ncbi:hypothetical protein AMAG_13048 [Allomyces macrogynus ATCC 38327]|uniref:Uncharacterized protein n=1 Tax=Allomyces macrogynus (strain ATCC 38327) TaxID=578462 RepID=A0A0L0T0W5_ALLM3|nr:hypothetical protein AMAG_13048 [Allomyces macrogynus ATCC 38327]|eukprot:KNE68392.1 hypothetical protein AMAG_13048 [Allomyces macrogynus ATCC 38327]
MIRTRSPPNNMDGPLNPPRGSNAPTAATAAPRSPSMSTTSRSRQQHNYGPTSSDHDPAHDRDVSVNSLLADLAHDLDALNARELARLRDIESAAIAHTHALPNGISRPDLSTLSSSVDLHADTVLDELKLAMDLDDARHDPWTFHRSFSELSLGPQATPMPASLLGGTRALYSHFGASSFLPYSRPAVRTDTVAPNNGAPLDRDAQSQISDSTHDDEEVVPFSRISVGEMDGIAHESQFSFLTSRRPGGAAVPIITPTSNVVTPDLSEPSRYFEDAPQASFVTPRSHTRSATATTTTASRPTSTAPSALRRTDGAVSPPSPPPRTSRSPVTAHRAAADDDLDGEMPPLLPSIHLDASASAADLPATVDDPLERTVRPPRTSTSAASPDRRASPAAPSWSPTCAVAPTAPRADPDSSASDTSGLSMTVKAMTTPARRTAAAAPVSPVKSAPTPPMFAPRASPGSSVTTTSPPTWMRDLPGVPAATHARASPAAVPPVVEAANAADESVTDVPHFRAVVPTNSTSPAAAVAADRIARSPAHTPTAAVSSTDTDSGLATAIDHLTRRVKALTDERGALAAQCATLTADRDRLAHELVQTRDQVVSLDRDRAAKQLVLRERAAAVADLSARVQSLERVVREQQEVLEEHRRLMARRQEVERRDQDARDGGVLIEDRGGENAWRHASPAPASARGSTIVGRSSPREAWAAAAPAPPPRAASRDLGGQDYHQPYDLPAAPVYSHPASPAVHPAATYAVPPSTTSSVTSSPAHPRTRRVREFSVQTDVVDMPFASPAPAKRRSPTPTSSAPPGARHHQHAADLHEEEADQARIERRARRARLEREIHRRVKQLLAAKLRRDRDASDDDGASAVDDEEREEMPQRRASAAPARRRTAEYGGPRPRSHSPTAASRARVAATHQHQHQHSRAVAAAAPPAAPAPAVVPIPVPFVVGTATGKSHSVPVNLQRVLHLVKAAAPPPPVVKKPRKPAAGVGSARRASSGPPVVRAADKPLVRNLSLLRSSQKMQTVLLQGGVGSAADGVV